MLSFGIITDEDDFSDTNYENNNTELQKKDFEKNILNNISFESDINNNNSMESKAENDNKKANEQYFKTKEQINEIKIIIYYALSLGCQLFRDFPSSYFTLFPKNENEVKAKRLIAQKFCIDNKKIIYKDKDYVFVPIQATSHAFTFEYNGELITYKKDKTNKNNTIEIKINNEPLLTIEQFLEKFKDSEIKKMVGESESAENIGEKSNKGKKSKKSSQSKDENINSKSSNLSYMTTTDDSETETKGERYYKLIKKMNI